MLDWIINSRMKSANIRAQEHIRRNYSRDDLIRFGYSKEQINTWLG